MKNLTITGLSDRAEELYNLACKHGLKICLFRQINEHQDSGVLNVFVQEYKPEYDMGDFQISLGLLFECEVTVCTREASSYDDPEFKLNLDQKFVEISSLFDNGGPVDKEKLLADLKACYGDDWSFNANESFELPPLDSTVSSSMKGSHSGAQQPPAFTLASIQQMIFGFLSMAQNLQSLAITSYPRLDLKKFNAEILAMLAASLQGQQSPDFFISSFLPLQPIQSTLFGSFPIKVELLVAAAARNDTNCLRALLSNRELCSAIDSVNLAGDSALCAAITGNHREAIACLIGHGADRHQAKNSAGKTAAQLVSEYQETARLFDPVGVEVKPALA